jgi:hypothetical protein
MLLLLTAGRHFRINDPIVPKLLIPEISGILMESIAPKSIMFLLIIDALFTVILLRLCGVFDSKRKICFYL